MEKNRNFEVDWKGEKIKLITIRLEAYANVKEKIRSSTIKLNYKFI